MRCPEDSAFIGQRFRVETHILREHLTPEFDSPFSCLLCKFACLKYKELERHINHYQPHQILRREAIKEGLYTSDSAYFITNPSPIHFTDSDCCILSRDDSTKQYQKIPTLPLPLSTDLNFDKQKNLYLNLLPTALLLDLCLLLLMTTNLTWKQFWTVCRIRRLMFVLSPISWFWAILQFRHRMSLMNQILKSLMLHVLTFWLLHHVHRLLARLTCHHQFVK